MIYSRFGFGFKTALLLTTALFLNGCYKIEIKETLQLDGTSQIAINMDMSQMLNIMNGVTESLPSSVTKPITYESCNDSALLKEFGVTDLDGPSLVVKALEVEKMTACSPAQTSGTIDLITTHTEKSSGRVLKEKTLSRKAEDCQSPAILAFYKVDSFEKPLIESYTLQESIDISCNEDQESVTINTLTRLGEEDAVPQTQIFTKPALTTPNTSPKNQPEDSAEHSKNPNTLAETFNFCEEVEQDPEQMPFFFDKCENLAFGVGAFHFFKYDTTGFTVNSNQTVTYSLGGSTQVIKDDINQEIKDENASSQTPMDPAAIGLVAEYVLISPWPIADHSHGQLENEFTLRVNLLEVDQSVPLTVTLKTNGESLNLLTPKVQNQIDTLITNLKDKLGASSAPAERQVEYIFHLSKKIQRLATLKPKVQVPLGYLQTKLIGLAKELNAFNSKDVQNDFLNETNTLTPQGLTEESLPTETTEIQSSSQEPLATVENTNTPNPSLVEELEDFKKTQEDIPNDETETSSESTPNIVTTEAEEPLKSAEESSESTPVVTE